MGAFHNYVDKNGGSVESPRWVTSQRVDSMKTVHICPFEGGTGQNQVHVVVECPLMSLDLT